MICPKCGTKINPAAELAKARAKKLSPERRKEIGQKAIAVRWAKERARKS